MIENAVTDLPHPDSPTIPSVVPRSTLKVTPSTACTSPSRVLKYVRRSLTSSSAIQELLEVLSSPRIERVAEAVGDEERAHDQPGDRQARHDDDVRVRLVGRVAVLRQRPPRGLRRVDAEAEEREESLAEHDARQLEEHEDDDHAERVR